MKLLKILLIISHLVAFSSASYGTLRGTNEQVARNGDDKAAADDDELGRPPKEAVMSVGGGSFKIRSALANNKVHYKDQEISDNTPGRSFPTPALNQSSPILDASKIFGRDNRYPFADTSFPYCTVGKVETSTTLCTGTVVGPRHVLTASHCVDYAGDGFNWMTFTPAYDNGAAPYGTFEGVWVYWLVQPDKDGDEYLSDYESAFDYAVFVLDGYPQTGSMGYKVYDSKWKDIPMWNHIGYPGTILNGESPVFSGKGFILSSHPHSVDASVHFPGAGKIEGYSMWNKIDSSSGQSGGPVYHDWPQADGGSCVIGVLSSSPEGGTDTEGRTRVGGGPALAFLINWAIEHYP